MTALLTAYRERAGLSQAALARGAGCEPSSVSRIERGTRHPTRGAVLDLALALGLLPHERDGLLMAFGYMPLGPQLVALFIDLAAHPEALPAVREVVALARERTRDGP